MKVVIYLSVALALVDWNSHSVNARLHSAEWEAYKEQHGKVYEDLTEDLQRYANYLASKKLVQEHNSAQSSFRLELNHMADWSINEFTTTSRETSENGVNDFESTLNSSFALPAELDWRSAQGYQVVSEVGDQGKCSSGYAFATTGLIEGQEAIRCSEGFVKLSVQQVVDCTIKNNGCKGGSVVVALDNLADHAGIESDQDYPYIGKRNAHCGYSEDKVLMGVDRFLVLPSDELIMRKYLLRYGPIAIELDATEKLMSYKSGVFEDSTCSKTKSNHSALIVGYGTDKQAGDFWIVKNSWSTKWGEQGYFRLRRGVNACGSERRPTIMKYF